MASAEVQISSSMMCSPMDCSRADRSRAVQMELLVSTRNGRPALRSAATNSSAPGMGRPSLTSTPSMSVSQAREAKPSVSSAWSGAGCVASMPTEGRPPEVDSDGLNSDT